MISISDIRNDERIVQLVQVVTTDFIQNSLPTPRPYLYQQLEGQEDILTTLVQRGFLQQLFADEVIPGLLAFEYHPNPVFLRQAKGYVGMVLQALSGLFEETGFKRRRFQVDEILARVKKQGQLLARPEHLRIALLLIPTLNGLLSEYHWNAEHSAIEWVEVTDKVLKPDSLETIWDSKVREILSRDEADQTALRVATTRREMLETAFDQYRLVKQIGEGGAGYVWQAKDSHGVDVAIKWLKLHRATEEKRRRFRNEILFSLSVHHPNIIRVIDFGLHVRPEGSVPFYVMPYMECSFRKMLSTNVELQNRLKYYGQLLDAVQVAHSKGVVHRDLKPENILFSSSEDAVVLADFGIAHFTDEDLYTAVETGDHSRLANFLYAAPEQKRRGSSIGPRTDIFALGLILSELFTGEVPYGTGYKKVHSVLPEFHWIDKIIDLMIQQDPEDRPPSIESIQTSLRRNLGGSADQNAVIVHHSEGEVPDRSAPIRVRALKVGFYRNSRRQAGDVFEIQHRWELGNWMEVLGEATDAATLHGLQGIVWEPESRENCLGILVKNAGIEPIQKLQVLAADFLEWSQTGNDFIQRSQQAKPGAVAIRETGDLEGSNDWSGFLPIVDCTQVESLRILSFHPREKGKSRVRHAFANPGVYRIRIRFCAQLETRDEYVFVHFERGKRPAFTSHPTN